MVILDATIVNVALPSIQHAFDSTLSNLQWIVAGYTLVFACLLIFVGNLADLVGAKKVLVVGLMLFILSSLACGLARNSTLLIIFRLWQGAGAAALVPCSLALLNASYKDSKDRAKAIGIWGAIGGIAAAAGPLLGGLLTASFGWPAIFLLNVPVGLITLALILKYSIQAIPQHKAHLDIPGQLFCIILLANLAYALIEAGKFGWLSLRIMIASLIFLASLIFFITTEKHNKQPIFPLKFFKHRNFSIAMLIGIIINFGLYGELFLFPLYFQQIRGYSTIATGFALAPLLMLVAIASYFSGRLASRLGAKLPLLIGLVIGMLGFFSLLIVKTNAPSYFMLILPLAAIGSGVAFTMPAATMLAIHALPQNRDGIASGIFTTGRQIGSLLGVAIFGSIITNTKDFIHGMHITLTMSGILFFIGFLFSLTIIGLTH